jgi:hypothetical protein
MNRLWLIGTLCQHDSKLKARRLLALTTLGLCLCFPSLASAKPLTKADIEGKNICWGNNPRNSFKTGGKVTNSVAGEGTWSISKAGVITVKFPSGPYSGVIRDLGGGSFEYSGSWIGTPKLTVGGGSFCN